MFYSVAAVAFVLAIYPFVLYPLSLLAIRSFRVQPLVRSPVSEYPRFSILFCAHNEELVIERKMQNLISAVKAYPGEAEILVYLDACTDRTKEVIQSVAADFVLCDQTQRVGKSRGMKTLMQRAAGDLVLFTDANVLLAEDCLLAAAEYFQNPSLGCLCGNLAITNPNESSTAVAGSSYWRFEEWLKQLETDTGSTVGADGSLFAIRRELFQEPPDDVIDDMHTSLAILASGYRVARGEEFRAYETTTVLAKDEFRRKMRISCRAFNCFRRLSPRLHRMSPFNIYKLYGHKVLRWLTVFPLICGGTLLLAGWISGGDWVEFFVAVLAALVIGALGFANLGIFGVAKEVFMALVATGLGIVESAMGRRYQVWTIERSSRPSNV